MNKIELASNAFSVPSGDVSILAVDDDPTALVMLGGLVSKLGYDTITATSGGEALSILEGNTDIRAVLLDREMPGLNGIETIRQLKENPQLARIPVVMVTGSNDPEQIREGIEAGVFYYLEKPTDARLLSSVLSAALRQGSQARMLQSSDVSTQCFDLTESVKFKFRTHDEAVKLSGFIANYFPEPDRVLDGAAALLFNAVEHGLCQIGFEFKGQLLESGEFTTELQRRITNLSLEKFATVGVMRRENGVLLAVTDPGPGFIWKDYVQIDMSRSNSSHGRGIMRAKAISFDEIKFNDRGNQVVGFMRKREGFEW